MSGSPRRRAWTGGVGVLVGVTVLVAVLAALSADDPEEGSPPVTAPPDAGPREEEPPAATTEPPTDPTTTTAVVEEAEVLLAWIPGGLPPGFSWAAGTLSDVDGITVVRGGQADLLRSLGADGAVVDAVTEGWALPLDTIAVDPRSFASFVEDEGDRERIGGLGRGEALLTTTSAELRGIDTGGTLELRGGTVRVAGVIDDHSGAAAELMIHVDDAERLGVASERYLLAAHRPATRATLEEALVDLARPHPVALRASTETTWLRHGDGVVPHVFVKQTFGEFAYRDLPGRAVEIDPRWVEQNIVTASVPVLGDIRCNRAMIDPLTTVLGELQTTGLGDLVDPSAFAGCWNARRIAEGLPLSKHAWGIAVDINIGADPRGSFATQDTRLVDLMRSVGFRWGGTWVHPDPGHYELDP